MQNLDQLRAATALKAAKDQTNKTNCQAVSRLPGMILSNGLLATTAFADERKDNDRPKRPEMKAAMDATARHLADDHVGIDRLKDKNTGSAMLDALSTEGAKPSDLQRATYEALAFLGFLKRFAPKGEQQSGS